MFSYQLPVYFLGLLVFHTGSLPEFTSLPGLPGLRFTGLPVQEPSYQVCQFASLPVYQFASLPVLRGVYSKFRNLPGFSFGFFSVSQFPWFRCFGLGFYSYLVSWYPRYPGIPGIPWYPRYPRYPWYRQSSTQKSAFFVYPTSDRDRIGTYHYQI